MKDSYSWLIAK